MMLTLMLTSKGVAGVPRAALVILAGTLATFHLPMEGVAVLLGVDARAGHGAHVGERAGQLPGERGGGALGRLQGRLALLRPAILKVRFQEPELFVHRAGDLGEQVGGRFVIVIVGLIDRLADCRSVMGVTFD